MKKIFFALVVMLLISISAISQTYKTNAVNNNFTGYNKLPATKTKIGNTALTETSVKDLDTLRSERINSIELSDYAVMKADSITGYVTPPSMETYFNNHSGKSDSIMVSATQPTTGNIYISSVDNRIHYKIGNVWYRLAVSDSISAITQSIIGYWKLDEASGNALDELELYNGTLENTPTQNVTGKLNKCYTFASSSSESIDIGSNAALRPQSGLSISFWIKTSTTDNGMIVSNYGLTGSGPYYTWGYEIGMIANGYIYFDTYQGSNGSGCGTNTSINIADNNWHFVVCTYDNSFAKIYIDGELSATSSTGSGLIYYQTSSFAVACRTGGGNYFNGSLDEIGLWGRSLTDTEVTTLYNSTTGITYPF